MKNLIFERIRQDITNNNIVLYIKGTAVFPQCGFSAAVVQIFSQIGVPFKEVNVLQDTALHEGLKKYANWPKTPQIYIKGEFIGGADIIREMYNNGELEALLEQHELNNSGKVA